MTIKPKKTNLKRLFIFNAILLIIAFAMIQYAVVKDEPIEPLNITPIAQGEFAKRLTIYDTPRDTPNIEFKTVFNKRMSLDDLKGQWVILNFWATWCPPCLVEMPSLQKSQDEYGGQGIEVVAVSLDRNMDGKKLRDFMAKHQFGAIAGYYGDWPTIKNQAEIKGLPTTYILSPNGQAIGVYQGDAEWFGDDARMFVESLINAPDMIEDLDKL